MLAPRTTARSPSLFIGHSAPKRYSTLWIAASRGYVQPPRFFVSHPLCRFSPQPVSIRNGSSPTSSPDRPRPPGPGWLPCSITPALATPSWLPRSTGWDDRLPRSPAPSLTLASTESRCGPCAKESTPPLLAGRAVAAIMATLAELELELGRERRVVSRESRRAQKLPVTKPPKLSEASPVSCTPRYV